MKFYFLILMFLNVCVIRSQNPLFWSADPSGIVVEDGRIFVFPTNDKKDWADQKEWHCWSTSDLVHWVDHGVIFNTEMSGWGVDNAWAPDITFKNGTYYFYYYFQNGGIGPGVGVATSKNPEGPFKEALGHKLINGHDPAVFTDDDGKSYLYYQNNVFQLNEDMISVKSTTPKKLNIGTVPSKFEATYVFKRNGVYYYTFALNFNNLVYYTGSSPEGPFTYRGEIMAPYGGNNHHSIIKYKDKWIIFYHEWASGSTVSNRRVRAEWLEFNEDGTIKLVKPTFKGISDSEFTVPINRTVTFNTTNVSNAKLIKTSSTAGIKKNSEISTGDNINTQLMIVRSVYDVNDSNLYSIKVNGEYMIYNANGTCGFTSDISTDELKKQATFKIDQSIFELGSFLSVESYFATGKYLRHRNSILYFDDAPATPKNDWGTKDFLWDLIPVQITNSTSKLVQSEISIYPNPAQSILTVNSELPVKSVNVFSSTGELLISGNNKVLNVTSLKQGIYFVEIDNGISINIKKMVKK